jgi:hypothetical protein
MNSDSGGRSTQQRRSPSRRISSGSESPSDSISMSSSVSLGCGPTLRNGTYGRFRIIPFMDADGSGFGLLAVSLVEAQKVFRLDSMKASFASLFRATFCAASYHHSRSSKSGVLSPIIVTLFCTVRSSPLQNLMTMVLSSTYSTTSISS